MSEWKRVKLGEVCSRICSGGTPKSTCSDYYENGEIPWLNTKEVHSNRIYDTEKKITQLGLDNSAAKWIKADSVIVAMYGATAGNVAQTRIPLTTNQACCNLEINSAVSNADFVFYYLRNCYNKLLLLANGAAQQNLNAQVIRDFEIPLPPLPTQRRIAAVLGALDDKIENNRKICANLEAQAEALFKSWFVDFEPFGGKMPSGWKMGKLTDIALYLNGLAMQKFRPTEGGASYPVLKIKELRQGFCDGESERCTAELESKYIVHDGDVIFSWSGSLLVDLWCGGDAGLNQHLFKVIPKGFPKWFVYYWTSQHLGDFINIAAGKATTMGHITREHLEGAVVTIPNDEALVEVGKSLGAFVDLIVEKRLESRALAATRDALLPKLMSGEIDVEKVEV